MDVALPRSEEQPVEAAEDVASWTEEQELWWLSRKRLTSTKMRESPSSASCEGHGGPEQM